MRNVVLSILLVVAGCSARAPADDRIDAYAHQAATTWSIPDLRIAVARDGRVLDVSAAGDGTQPSNDEPMPIASVTKQFTAAAILALSKTKQLALDDPIAKYVDVPAKWHGATIYHLLTHTSGIPRYSDAAGFHAQLSHAVTPRRLIAFAATIPAPVPAGTSWEYSNTNYVLLGMAIEKITGVSYGEHLRRTIFEPLGMHHTALCGRTPRGFRTREHGRETAPPLDPSQLWAAGGICSTAGDLARWEAALDGGAVLDAQLVRSMESPAHLDGGQPVPQYGIANELAVVNGHAVAGHSGGMLGFASAVVRLPDDRVSVAVLADHLNAPVDAIARHVAALYVPSLNATQPVPDANPVLTARLRAVVEKAVRGEADLNRFSYEDAMRNAFFIRSQGPALLGPLGALKTFVPVAAPRGTQPRYLATYERGEIEWQFTLDRERLIMEMEPTLR